MFKFLDHIAKNWITWDVFDDGYIVILHTGPAMLTYDPHFITRNASLFDCSCEGKWLYMRVLHLEFSYGW